MSDESERRKLSVAIDSEETGLGRRYRLTVWKPGGGCGLPITFSNRARAERVRRCLERELQPEQHRENLALEALVAEGGSER